MSGARPKKKVLVKIIIIGESGVGKTALLHKYVMGKFIEDHKATIGADFLTREINIDEKIVTLQIWDTAGQERFQSLGNAFYRGADACILVFDVTDERSFKQIEEWRTKFITQAAIEKPRAYPFLLLANKTDQESNRSITQNQGQSYANTHNMTFFETSALNGLNVDTGFREIAATASEQDTVPYFTEDLVKTINLMENDRNFDFEKGKDGAGCPCLLL